MKPKEISREEFNKLYRPGNIEFNGQVIATLADNEIVCDVCNASVVWQDDQGWHGKIYMDGSNALCESCAKHP